MSQTAKIKKHLLAGKKITPLQALRKFGCFRLAARISDLRGSMNVKTTIKVHKGKQYAEYSIK